MIGLKRWACSKAERGWVEAAYIYDACDAHCKYMCGLKDVDGKVVGSLRSLAREASRLGKGTKQTFTRPRKFMMRR